MMSGSSQETVPLYDSFDAYDRFVNWDRRLTYELPFIGRQLDGVGANQVLDVACGTGQHAIALAQRGYSVTGVDLSAAMIERAKANVAAAQVEGVHLTVAGFGRLSESLAGDFDAVLCLGNSLPHVLTEQSLHETLIDMATVTKPGGLLFVQTRNMDAVLDRRSRWMPLQARGVESLADEAAHEWLFVRFYDFNEDGSLTFNVVTLERSDSDGVWEQHVDATRLYPWRRRQLLDAVDKAGFVDVISYGDMTGAPYNREASGNLVLVARRAKAA